MSQVRPKGEKVGEIAAKAVVQRKSFTVDGLREKLREFFRQEVRAELRAVAALSNVDSLPRCCPATGNLPLSAFSSEFSTGWFRFSLPRSTTGPWPHI
jgi:hypothetical protein